MAHSYTDPKTGITRDEYGNEVAHDPTATTRHASSSYMPWIIGVGLAAIVASMLYNMNTTDRSSVTAPNDRPITEPLNKAPPATTP